MAHGEREAVPRVADLYAALPSITGKLELEYEGELQGAETIAKELIRRAALRTCQDRIGDDDDERLDRIVGWFDQGSALKISGDERSEVAIKAFALVPGLLPLVHDVGLARAGDHPMEVAAGELVLEALAAQKRISRSEDAGWARKRGAGSGER